MDDLMTSLQKANEEAEKALGGQPADTAAPQNTGYSSAQSGYSNAQNTGYGNSQPAGYGNTQSGYGSSQQSGYGSAQNTGYGNSQSTGYGSSQQSGYGSSQNTGYGNSQSTGYGNTQSGYGSSQQSGYGSSQNTGYGSANRSYNSSSTGYDPADSVSTVSYDSFGSYQSESQFVSLIKGALGAIVGALPGMLLIVLLSKLGFIAAASGLLLAGGIIFGYGLMTKDSDLDTKFGLIICGIVMVLGVYLSVRISWSWKMSSVLQESLATIKSSVLTDGESELSSAEVNSLLRAFFGVTDGSFGECFSNFGKLLTNLGLKGKFALSLFEHYAFTLLGGGAMFTKFGKN